MERSFENKYELLLDSTFLTDQHSFHAYMYNEDIDIDFYFQKPSLLINSTTTTVITDNNLAKISFEYDAVYEPSLAQQIIQLSDTYGLTYLYDYISYVSRNAIINQSDFTFPLKILDPRSVKGILMLFTLPQPTVN